MIKATWVTMLGLAVGVACTVEHDLDALSQPQEGANGFNASSSGVGEASGVGGHLVSLGGGSSSSPRLTDPDSPFFRVCAELEAAVGEAEGQLENRRRAFLQSYCTDSPMQTSWTSCVGFSFMGGVPVTTCASSVVPYIECLLAPETTSPAQCPQELDRGCDPHEGAASGDAPDTSACKSGVSRVNYPAGPTFESSLDQCDDGHRYGFLCHAPSSACAVSCDCFRDDVETSQIDFAGISDLTFLADLWSDCRYPVGAMGPGGAAAQ
jgi:hypothetical protein